MSIPRGTQSSVVVYEEDTYGTAPGTPKGTKLYMTSYGLTPTQELIQPATLTGDRQRSQPSNDVVDLSGDIAVEVSALSIGALLKHSIGTVVTTGASAPYTHDFTPSDLPTSLLCELDNGADAAGANRYEQSLGVRVNNTTYTFPASGYATATFSAVGRDAAASATPLDASPLDPGHRSTPMVKATIEEASATLSVATNITITINNNIDTGVRAIGPGGLRVAAPEGFVDVSGTLEVLWNSAILAKAQNGTPSDLKVILTWGDGTGTDGNEYLELFVGKLIFQRTGSMVDGPGVRRVTMNFQGYKDGSTNSISAQIKSKNATVVKP